MFFKSKQLRNLHVCEFGELLYCLTEILFDDLDWSAVTIYSAQEVCSYVLIYHLLPVWPASTNLISSYI